MRLPWQLYLDDKLAMQLDEMAPKGTTDFWMANLTSDQGFIATSAGSKHVAFAGRRGGKWRIYVDGTPGPEFDGLASGPLVCADGHLEYLVIQKDGAKENLVRVEIPGFGAVKKR